MIHLDHVRREENSMFPSYRSKTNSVGTSYDEMIEYIYDASWIYLLEARGSRDLCAVRVQSSNVACHIQSWNVPSMFRLRSSQ